MTTVKSIAIRCVFTALLFFASGAARGDAIQLENRRPLDNIVITGVRAGTLVYRLPEGREAAQDLARVERIVFARWPLFNLAEKQRVAGEFRMAANTYEKALEVLKQQAGAARPMQPAEWSGEDLALLVQCRLIGAYDRANRFDLAVKSYLAVVERMPEAIVSLRPETMPPPQSAFRRAAREQVEQAVARSDDGAFREKMREWLDTWPEPEPVTTRPDPQASPNGDDGEAGSGGSPRGEAPDSPGASFRRAMESVAAGIAGHAYQEALSQLDELGKRFPHRPAAWYYWRGRALEGLAPTLAADQRREASILGGLAYLRVVVHFPQDERAPESLFRTGAICAHLGESEQAAAVWRDLLKRWPDASPWNRLAAEKLERGP